MEFKYLKIDVSEKIAVVSINRPEVLNALNPSVLEELGAAFAAMANDPEVKAVIISGAGGKAFVAGADIGAMAKFGPLEARRYIVLGHKTFDAIAAFPKPVIAAVNGFALGGGLELSLSCDFIYAAETARFGLPEITLGIIPGWGGTQRLTAAIGPCKAKEMIYTGKIIDAAEAAAIGLVNSVLPLEGFLEAVREKVKKITAMSAVPLTMSKTAVNAFMESGGQVGREVEIQSVCICFSAEDQKEGMAAFLEKRKPAFRDK
jgi:enoyl-CoA hydratase